MASLLVNQLISALVVAILLAETPEIKSGGVVVGGVHWGSGGVQGQIGGQVAITPPQSLEQLVLFSPVSQTPSLSHGQSAEQFAYVSPESQTPSLLHCVTVNVTSMVLVEDAPKTEAAKAAPRKIALITTPNRILDIISKVKINWCKRSR
jgi:hypothetical protein